MSESLEGSDIDGTTPIDEDEAAGLIPDIHTRGELNAWELTNILKAERWARNGRRGEILSVEFVKELHRRMFDETWRWAGEFRQSDKSIGVYWATIQADLLNLMEDVKYWVDHPTFPPDEILARLHHRLASIHPFPNGNGRHARLMTDLLARRMGLPRPTWGRANLAIAGKAREVYIAALKQADRGSIQQLINFLRS